MSDASIRVMQLLDEMEEIIENASKVPFSDKTIIDGEEMAGIIDDIRLSLPKDIRQAKWVKDEQERILSEAKSEYDKVIIAAKKQAEYLVETDAIKKEAEKRADAILSEAENHSRYMKLRSYEYIDKLLYDMQNELTGLASEFIQPMTDRFVGVLGEVNEKVNENRHEMKSMAERIQSGTDPSSYETSAYAPSAPDYSEDDETYSE